MHLNLKIFVQAVVREPTHYEKTAKEEFSAALRMRQTDLSIFISVD